MTKMSIENHELNARSTATSRFEGENIILIPIYDDAGQEITGNHNIFPFQVSALK